jgi:hypothetical protein
MSTDTIVGRRLFTGGATRGLRRADPGGALVVCPSAPARTNLNWCPTFGRDPVNDRNDSRSPPYTERTVLRLECTSESTEREGRGGSATVGARARWRSRRSRITGRPANGVRINRTRLGIANPLDRRRRENR